MTIRDRFWFVCADALAGLADVPGEPTVLEVDSEGEARTSLVAPPPLLDAPPCVAAAEASCEGCCDVIVRAREDSSWPTGGCCPACEGEKGDEVDDAADDLRLPT